MYFYHSTRDANISATKSSYEKYAKYKCLHLNNGEIDKNIPWQKFFSIIIVNVQLICMYVLIITIRYNYSNYVL